PCDGLHGIGTIYSRVRLLSSVAQALNDGRAKADGEDPMEGTDRTEDRAGDDRIEAARERLLDAALPHVVFDGWTEATLRRAAAETGDDMQLARLAFPRGAIDMALAFHRRADRELARALDRADLDSMRVRDRIAFAVKK